MNKQEEVREGIASRYCYETYGSLLSYVISELGDNDYRVKASYKFADGELGSLHSQGVVIKVDRELPEGFIENLLDRCSITRWNYDKLQLAMLRAGYEAVEPLIKER